MAKKGTPKCVRPRRPAGARPFHLFVYGTLMNPAVFRAVLGHKVATRPAEGDSGDCFVAHRAVLPGYKTISPDGTYLYAVPDAHGRIRGRLVGPLGGECLAALRRYEGRNYSQVRLKVLTAEGPVRAVVFVGNQQQWSHGFGWRFHDHLKQEVLLESKIEKALLADEIRRLQTDEQLTRRALRELHGRTIGDLIRRHFDAGGISDFAIAQAISQEPLPDFHDITAQAQARRLAPAYLSLLVRQVIFNQIEDHIRSEFRYELDQMGISERFHERTISTLAALRLLNEQAGLMHLLVGDALAELPPASRRLIDHVRWAIVAADWVYESARVREQIEYIRRHMGSGYVPLGAELEFSNIGHDVILRRQGTRHRDPQYDSFLYFRDFGLDILTWKLGGHVDDHRVKSSPSRRRGFFELALGLLSVESNISKPITDDPWLLNQLIHEAIDFYDIAPHSLHLSLQLRSPRPVEDRPLPVGIMKCLFALAGDPRRDSRGGVRIARLCGEDITGGAPAGASMLFAQISRRRAAEADDVPVSRGRWVQQFKFLRLNRRINYEPIIMALKGLQIHCKPGSFLTSRQHASRPELAELFDELMRWGRSAEPLAKADIGQFLSAVRDGLMREHRGRPAHSRAYVAYCLAQLRAGLEGFNALVQGKDVSVESAPAH